MVIVTSDVYQTSNVRGVSCDHCGEESEGAPDECASEGDTNEGEESEYDLMRKSDEFSMDLFIEVY